MEFMGLNQEVKTGSWPNRKEELSLAFWRERKKIATEAKTHLGSLHIENLLIPEWIKSTEEFQERSRFQGFIPIWPEEQKPEKFSAKLLANSK